MSPVTIPLMTKFSVVLLFPLNKETLHCSERGHAVNAS